MGSDDCDAPVIASACQSENDGSDVETVSNSEGSIPPPLDSDDDEPHSDSWSAISCSEDDFDAEDLLLDHFGVLDDFNSSADERCAPLFGPAAGASGAELRSCLRRKFSENKVRT